MLLYTSSLIWYLSSESINARSVPGTLAVIHAWTKTQVPLFFFNMWDVWLFIYLYPILPIFLIKVYQSLKLLLKHLPCALMDFYVFVIMFLPVSSLSAFTSCDKSLEVLLTKSWKHAPHTELQTFYGIIKALFYSPSKEFLIPHEKCVPS